MRFDALWPVRCLRIIEHRQVPIHSRPPTRPHSSIRTRQVTDGNLERHRAKGLILIDCQADFCGNRGVVPALKELPVFAPTISIAPTKLTIGRVC